KLSGIAGGRAFGHRLRRGPRGGGVAEPAPQNGGGGRGGGGRRRLYGRTKTTGPPRPGPAKLVARQRNPAKWLPALRRNAKPWLSWTIPIWPMSSTAARPPQAGLTS